MSDCKCDFSLGRWSCTCDALAREKSLTRPNDGRVKLAEHEGWHAWFSPTAEGGYINTYADKDGNPVVITEVKRNPERSSYKNAVYLGIVVKHLTCVNRRSVGV